eukprot:144412-Rhodomonas_salina.1
MPTGTMTYACSCCCTVCEPGHSRSDLETTAFRAKPRIAKRLSGGGAISVMMGAMRVVLNAPGLKGLGSGRDLLQPDRAS